MVKMMKKVFLYILLSINIFFYICASIFKIDNSFAIKIYKMYYILKIYRNVSQYYDPHSGLQGEEGLRSSSENISIITCSPFCELLMT